MNSQDCGHCCTNWSYLHQLRGSECVRIIESSKAAKTLTYIDRVLHHNSHEFARFFCHRSNCLSASLSEETSHSRLICKREPPSVLIARQLYRHLKESIRTAVTFLNGIFAEMWEIFHFEANTVGCFDCNFVLNFNLPRSLFAQKE